MKIVAINSVHNGSTGNIMRKISACAYSRGAIVHTFSTYNFSVSKNIKKLFEKEVLPMLENHTYYGSKASRAVHVIAGIITGLNGYYSYFATRSLIKKIDEITPDIIHLHNIHQYCINIPLLIKYINKKKIPVIWTLHDCWTFTGHCAHYDMIQCNKWQTKCFHCPLYKYYPKSIFDNSRFMFDQKKKMFNSIENLHIVTPSKWLSNEVKKSYLNHHSVTVINNGINTNLFKPLPDSERTMFEANKFVVLGVAASWDNTKGLDVFINIAKHLRDNEYSIVLVGTDETIDSYLPTNITSIHRTENVEQLVHLYASADVFVNPTREDTFPTVNMEALACGTPVITYDTGGSPEIIDNTCGVVIPKNDEKKLIEEIRKIKDSRPFNRQACRKRALMFNEKVKFEEYYRLYCDIAHNKR